MEINDKKLKRTRKIINFLISVILAAFLIQLASIIISDLDSAIEYPQFEDYKNKEQERILDREVGQINKQIRSLNESKSNIDKMISTAQQNKEAEQQSFDNWIKTRTTLGSPQQDPEVLKRIAKLDEYQYVVQSWTSQTDSISDILSTLYNQSSVVNNKKEEERSIAYAIYEKAENRYALKVFLIRLLFAAPILALGIFLFVKHRRHKLSPLFMGFSLFSVYIFFYGLVPYLPSYGGYVRYSVGILLTIGLGYYAIKRLRDYSEKKKAELQASSTERASNLQSDIAEKAFNNHVCPSCGKDFILKNWERLEGIDIQSAKPIASSYCRYCGLQLLKGCEVCKQANYAHLPHCINCGENLK